MRARLGLLQSVACAAGLFLVIVSRVVHAEPAPEVAAVMDNVVQRMYDALTLDELANAGYETIWKFITPQERTVLATKYWTFDVNVPVVVSVMRHNEQEVAPFWLAEAGFQKTALAVRNELNVYEVWQKRFEAGRVELGINGFDKHRPHYFVAVGPQRPGTPLRVTNLMPAAYSKSLMCEGALTYHDWTELVLEEVPPELTGHVLLTTVRGRAREAHLIGAFRQTPFPSSEKPDHLALTWSAEPATTQTIQWRTGTAVENGVVQYRPKQAAADAPWQSVTAEKAVIKDRLLANDPVCHWFTAALTGLQPAAAYVYRVGDATPDHWSEESEFTTGPASATPFTFVFMGDTHRSPQWGEMLGNAFARHPETAFYMLGGDLVGTGLYRDDWDQFFEYSTAVFRQRPAVPCIGNHDDQDGLGAGMYLEMFGLPQNGPEGIAPERMYSFEYGNALFLILDIDTPLDIQAAWMEAQLANTNATWKFAMFHFPPYAPTEDYPDIRAVWGPVFDKYHVDMVFGGHVHHYLRSKPMREGKPAGSPAEGTIYLVSVGIPSKDWSGGGPDYAEVIFSGPALYQTLYIDGNTLELRAYSADGNERDRLTIVK
ncbi:MAG TPA: metallophosphoesterase family protein [Candidatus Hydrogenedentes bacterium]|nr:metallophosphoesterase family protein [Candidatus Hydrogenedentota bacterium]HQH52946.1 metallophosphoesterase family protein [Candidatus Hydrogenedentota bacterium]